ncbi:MAG: amidohydrolase family protein [Fibrobacterales bacterium]
MHSIEAGYILPISSEALINARLEWSDHTITEVRSCTHHDLESNITYSFPNAVVLPGLINTHCHLELGMLKGKTRPNIPFTQWADQLKNLLTSYTSFDFHDAVTTGLDAALKSGTTTLVDVGFSQANIDSPKTHINLLSHKELIGIPPSAATNLASQAVVEISKVIPTSLFTPSLSAHAPFSCSRELISEVIDYCHKQSVPFMMHLSESQEEQEHYSQTKGSMFDFLLSRFSDYTPPQPQLNAVDYCLTHDLIPNNSLMVHCNHITSKQLDYFAQNNISIAHCPRSRAFFNHAPFPLVEALKANTTITLGTDSLASNHSLNLWEEMTYLYTHHYSEVTALHILRMATLQGAQSIGRGESTGSLEKGKKADFIVATPSKSTDNPYIDLVSTPPTIEMVVVQGSIVYQREQP